MMLKPLTDGSVTSTGSLTFTSGIFGGVLISADGTNAATVTVQANNSSGASVFELVTKSPIFVTGPIGILDAAGAATQTGYYSVTGTGAGAQFYEWVE